MVLLEASGRVFSRLPYDQAKLKDISDEVGASQGSIYFHFGNKYDIAEAVLVVQAGLQLVDSLPEALRDHGHNSYVTWQVNGAVLIERGVDDGSITSTASYPSCARSCGPEPAR